MIFSNVIQCTNRLDIWSIVPNLWWSNWCKIICPFNLPWWICDLVSYFINRCGPSKRDRFNLTWCSLITVCKLILDRPGNLVTQCQSHWVVIWRQSFNLMLQRDRVVLHRSILVEDDATLWIIVANNFIALIFKLLDRCRWTVIWRWTEWARQISNWNCLPRCCIHKCNRCFFFVWSINNVLHNVTCIGSHVIHSSNLGNTWSVARNGWWINGWEVVIANWSPCAVSYFAGNLVFCCCPGKRYFICYALSGRFTVCISISNRFADSLR